MSYGFIVRARAALLRIVQAMLLRVLRGLDPDFSLGVLKANAPADDLECFRPGVLLKPPTAGSAAPIAPCSMRSPVVLNHADNTVSRELISFYLHGVFTNAAEHRFVSDLCGMELANSMTITMAESAIEERLHALADQEDSPPLALECYRSLLSHKITTKENRDAYSPKGKKRPSALFWPDPTDSRNRRSIFEELPYVEANPFITRDTPIASAGSCFATEIAAYLQREGFNYVITEGNTDAGGTYRMLDAGDHCAASAAWGLLFNTPSFRQLVEKAFGIRDLPKILWTQEREGAWRFYDPFRENVEFPSLEAFAANYELHKAACRAALLKAKVFVVTLGLNEVWYFKCDGSVFSRSPWRMAPNLIAHKRLTVEENVNDLQHMLDILRAYNSDVELIVTVSPIPLHATFQAEHTHIITANSHSKAVLRVAAEAFVSRNERAHYFPSYELVTNCTERPWAADQRHVTSATVARVMELFRASYMASD